MERLFHAPFEKKLENPLTEREEERYFNLVKDAATAKAYPSQSGYYVRTAGLAKDGVTCLGGNKEFALSNAFVHGETAVVSAIKDLTESPIEAVAWHKEQKKKDEVVGPQDFGRPCGNCRDVLSDYAGPELALLNGNQTGFVYTHLKDFLFEDFRFLDLSAVADRDVEEALVAKEAAVDVYLSGDRKKKVYGTALVGEDGTFWRGIFYTNAGYHAVGPILSAVINWDNTYPRGEISKTHLNLAKLVVVGIGEIPSPLYSDRQALLEFDEILRRFSGKDEPLEIQLVNFDNGVVSAKKTNAVEWLPRPFTPGAFRMDDVIFSRLSKLVGEAEAKKIFEREQK